MLKTKPITFRDLVNNKRYATILANLVKISKEEFILKKSTVKYFIMQLS